MKNYSNNSASYPNNKSQGNNNMFLENISSINQTSMSSREIAELTGKQPKHVNRDILLMFKELGLDRSNFGRIYLDGLNRKQTEYILDKELTFTLVTGYSIKLRNAVIKRWLYLEHRTTSLQERLNKACAKEDYDKAIGSIHGRGLAERKKTKRINSCEISEILSQMQLSFNFNNKRGLL